VTNLITPRSLFSPIFLQSCSVIHESGSDDPLPRYGRSKFSKMRGRSVGRSSVLNIYIVLMYSFLFATLGTLRASSKNIYVYIKRENENSSSRFRGVATNLLRGSKEGIWGRKSPSGVQGQSPGMGSLGEAPRSRR